MKSRVTITPLKTAALVGFLWLSSSSFALAGTPQPNGSTPVDVVHTQGQESRSAFAKTYEQRAQGNEKLKSFEGGGAGLYIGGSTAAIVLLVVILVLVL